MKISLAFLFFLIFFSGIAGATDINLNPCNQNTINTALQTVYDNGGGTVYLSSGVYNIDGQIRIGSNTILTGSPDAIIRVSSSSSQWFVDGVGVIGSISEPLNNVDISGFQVDGNCKNLPTSYASSGAGDHNSERLIDLRASTGAYSNNISIHDLKLYDAFSDGVHITFAQNVNIHNVFCSDCQHSSLYFVDVLSGEINNNEVAGITSDCIRLDNCQYVKVHDNLLYSFTGDSNGAYETGQNGLQAGDQGFSHGGGSPKPDHTENIEIFNNTFAGKMLMAVCLDAAGKQEGNNVYVHDNKFVDVSGLNTSGISFTNPPTVEQSEQIFSSIFDILKEQFTSSGYVDQGTIVPAITWENKGLYTSAWLDVPVFNNTVRVRNETYITGSPKDCAYVIYGTSSSAVYPDGQEVSKSLTVEPDNKLRVDLTVKTGYKVPETRHIKVLGFTLNQTIYKNRYETVTFSKTFDTPKQYPTLSASDFNVSVTYYNNSYAPHTLVYINSPYQNLISEVHYSFNGSYAVDCCLIGQVQNKANGAKVTDFNNLDYWKFSDNQMSYSYKGLYIKNNFDLSKFNVTIKTPYSEYEIKHFNYTEEGDPTDHINRNAVRIGLCIAFLIPFLYAIVKELSFVMKRGV